MIRNTSDLLAGPDLDIYPSDAPMELQATVPMSFVINPSDEIAAPVMESLSSPPVRVPFDPNDSYVKAKRDLGMTASPLDFLKDSVGSLQSAIAKPLQSAGRTMGGDTGSALAVPVALLLAAAGVAALVHHNSKGKKSFFKPARKGGNRSTSFKF